ncbi:MAG: CRISPR-associated endonuclease Cas2 [candidate division WOR-3 bacterium]|nr:CRISPR-associated endonuclease Cas2 [candidate division WOR-3 bacterium]MDW8151295.1 CRISPR-associated endonuclease Cas2 [candidate division WOR-3 bacterium]
MFVILVYDVEEKRVYKVHKICSKYLTWVQNSVFEGEITEAQLRILKDELKEIIDKTKDSVIIYKFRTKAYFEREDIGIKKPSSEDYFI